MTSLSELKSGASIERETVEAVSDDQGVTRAVLVCRTQAGTRIIDLEEGRVATVGRAPEMTVQVNLPQVSRKHATFSFSGGRLSVEDFGSRNGTIVNGRVLRNATCAVSGGGVVRIGTCEIFIAMVRPLRSDKNDPVRSDLLVADPEMRALLGVAGKVARTSTTVLILGETGVGKEVLAARIHELSPRRDAPMICINAACMPESLLESQLFGHEKGAFTGQIDAGKGTSRLPTAAHSSSTKSESFRGKRRRSFCACSRIEPLPGSAEPMMFQWTCASYARRTAIYVRSSSSEPSALTFSIGLRRSL